MRAALLTAVADSIAAAELAGVPAPTTSYRPLVQLSELGTAHLVVLPAGRETETITRGEDQDRWSVFVALRKKLPKRVDAAGERQAIDAVLALGELVWEHLRRRDLRVGGTRYVWQSNETAAGADAGYAPEHLEDPRVVTAIYRITYEAAD